MRGYAACFLPDSRLLGNDGETMGELILVQTAFAQRAHAEAAADALVERRLAACVQVSGPVRSSYRWEGKMQREEEYMLTAKTLAGRYEQVAAFLRETHPYELPEIIAVAVHAADGAYLDWAKEQCTG